MSKLTGSGQTIADLSLELYGEAGHEVEIIQENGLEDIYEAIPTSTEVLEPVIDSNEVLEYYKRNTTKPTSRYPEGVTFGAYSEGYSEGYD
jgi:hypothetical protein